MKNNILNISLIVLSAGILIIAFYFWRFRPAIVSPLPDLGTVPEFSLLTQDSTSYTKAHLTNNITIVDFIFTSCGGPCPLMSSKMTELQETFNNEQHVRLLSFSVDPEYDTPSILKAYGQAFKAKSDRWTFLTGEKQTIYNLARYGFHLTVEDEENAILHSTKFILIDHNAAIRGYYDYDDSTAIPTLIRDVQTLLNE